MADSTVVEDVTATLSIEGETLNVLSFSLQRSLCTVDELKVRAVKYDDVLPSPEAVVGMKAEFRLTRTHDDQTHVFAGEVYSVERGFDATGMDSLTIVVKPRLWRLQARTNCRRFLKQSTPDIVKNVLTQAGIAENEQRWQLSGSYPPHDSVTQYRETDYDFVWRLLTEAGIYVAPTSHDTPDVWCFTDETKGLGSCEVDELPFITDSGSRRLLDVARHVERRHLIRQDKVTLRDYDFTNPKVELHQTVESSDDGPHESEIYQFPGRFKDASVGKQLAQVLLESVQAERDVVEMSVGSISQLPGYTLRLADHPYAPLNREYLVTGVLLESQAQGQFELKAVSDQSGGTSPTLRYSSRITAIPTERSAYRPPRRPVERIVPGHQTALTCGPNGEEIHTNENGQVIAKFHWDRESAPDENASTWMRTSQVPTGGSMLLPRMNWEVSVVYREGDVDQPYVMSRLYNGLTPPPYALPQNAGKMALQTTTTPGGGSSNELRMSDAKGSEEMFFNASRDMSIQVGNNTTESIGNDAKTTVGVDHSLNVTDSITSTIGANQTLTVGANLDMAVTSLMVEDIAADHSLSVGGNRNQMIGGDHRHTVAGNSSVTVGANDIALVVGTVSNNTTRNRTHTVGAALVEITPQDRSISVKGPRTETSGALKVIVTKAGRGVESKMATSMVGGAFLTKVDGDRLDSATGPISDLAAGVQILKGKNVTFEAQSALSIVMGGSTLTLTPAAISIAGASVTVDGKASHLGIVLNN
jgi:type VI secretion system secreted protein VgrG